MKYAKPVIAVLLGDYAGIGPEIVAKCCKSGFLTDSLIPLIVGSKKIFDDALHLTGTDILYRVIENASDFSVETGVITLLNQETGGEVAEFGKNIPQCGEAVVRMINTSAELHRAGLVDAVCYAPFNKTSIKLAGYKVEGEIDLFCQALDVDGKTGEMNCADGLWTTRVTGHIPFREIAASLSKESIYDAIVMAHDTIKRTGVEKPRIAICALNPHGGESGTCGAEEIEIILPAAEQAEKDGINVCGVFPADTIFIDAFNGNFDAVVTLYHDQGQIALKIKDFASAVTILAGLPLPVGTPAHGTAFDIAGKGKASVSAFEAAMNILVRQAANKG